MRCISSRIVHLIILERRRNYIQKRHKVYINNNKPSSFQSLFSFSHLSTITKHCLFSYLSFSNPLKASPLRRNQPPCVRRFNPLHSLSQEQSQFSIPKELWICFFALPIFGLAIAPPRRCCMLFSSLDLCLLTFFSSPQATTCQGVAFISSPSSEHQSEVCVHLLVFMFYFYVSFLFLSSFLLFW